jgi:acetylornithine deacetylase/succinyl-diaminopimelate desuccinylase-like protein
VPHFYDGITGVSSENLKNYSYFHDAKYYEETCGIHVLGGEVEKSLQARNCLRPTVEINGMNGGYTGLGFKTVIPAKATAKISCRLVAGQDPEKIGLAMADFLKKNIVRGMEIQVEVHEGARAFLGNKNSLLAKVVSHAAEEVTGVSCHRTLSGGSIPIIEEMRIASGGDVVGMGFCLSDDCIHAPNEHFDMHRFQQGFLTVGRTLGLLGSDFYE